MLLGAAISLVIAVLLGTAAVIAIDLWPRRRSEWHTAIKEWQTLIGAVLGFLGAAGVLVLSAELQSNQARQQSLEEAHAIGLGLAIEVERLSVGLQAGLAMGGMIDIAADPDIAVTCNSYVATLKRVLAPDTPVYDAVLTRMVDFGDANLAIFVRFYSYYEDLGRSLAEIDTPACAARGADEITYAIRQLEGGMGFYGIIAQRYDIVPIAPGGS